MTPTIVMKDLNRRYGDHHALDKITLDISRDSITGLLGRNGAGKSTFMRIVAAQEYASSGTVRVFGEDPMENDRILRRMIFVREDQVFPDYKVRQIMKVASWFYPNWNEELAQSLLEEFDLPLNRVVKKLSRGMRSAVGIVIGLAARADLTLLDEPYAGLDAVARQIFYDRLLTDYAEHPRTVLLSTHLIDEVADLLEHIVMIDHGRIVMDAAADEIRGHAATVSGATRSVTTSWPGATYSTAGPWPGDPRWSSPVGFILSGPWYLTWLTSFVGLGLIFVYGMWFGLVYRRWNLVGLFTFIAAQITVLLAVALAVTWAHVWHGLGHFFSSLSAIGVTGVLAALALLLVVGGAGTMRRVTV